MRWRDRCFRNLSGPCPGAEQRVCLFIHLSVCLSVCLSVRPSICLSDPSPSGPTLRALQDGLDAMEVFFGVAKRVVLHLARERPMHTIDQLAYEISEQLHEEERPASAAPMPALDRQADGRLSGLLPASSASSANSQVP
jgi:hypothetical protein